MDDSHKSKEQLIVELQALRTEVNSLSGDAAKRAQLANGLRRSEDWYRVVSELTSDYAFAYRVEPDGELVREWVTGALLKISGFTADELKALGGWSSMVYPDDISIPLAQFKTVLTGQPDTVEYRIITKNGEVRWTRDYSRPVWDEEEQRVTHIYGAIQDITERKHAQLELERLLTLEREQRLLAETMATVSLALTAQISHTAVLEEILHQVQRIVPFTAANIVLLEKGMLRYAHWQGYDRMGTDEWMLTLVQPLTGLPLDLEVVQTRQPLVIPDCRQEPRWLSFPETAWILSYLVEPICLHDRVLGLLRLVDDQAHQFSQKDAQRLLPLTNAAAIALENARLYEEAQQEINERKLAEAELENKTRQQDMLLQMAQHLTASLDVKEVLTRVGVGAKQVLHSHGCSIYLLEPDGQTLRPVVSLDPPYDEMLLNMPLDVDTSFTGQAVKARRSLIFNDAETFEIGQQIPGTPDEHEHIIAAPFVAGGEVHGAMCLNRFETRYDEEDRMVAETFAAYATIALENARAYDGLQKEVQKRIQAEASLRTTNNRLAAALDELQETQTRLIQQERLAAVGQLAAGIAHDFNNLMAAILLYTELMLKTSTLSAKDQKKLQVIHRQGQRAADLTQQILDFSRKSIMKREDLDLQLFLQELNQLLLRTMPENIQLSLNSRAERCLVNADPTRLQQVILNLAINARDALSDGGELEIMLEQVQVGEDGKRPFPDMTPGNWARLSISDSGPGIDDDILPHIFEPFFTTKGALGSGLGLAQVYGIIKQHGGYVDVTTIPGKGTRFNLYLPVLSQIESGVEKTPSPPLSPGQGEIILIVEDDSHIRAVLQEALETLNYRVLTAVNGREALALCQLRGQEIALVMSDLIMPEMGGKELLRSLQQFNPAIKIVIVTGYPMENVEAELQAFAGVSRLQKPINLEQLGAVVGTALQSRTK